MRFTTCIIYMVLSLLLFAACKKPEKNPPPAPVKTQKQLLTDGKWHWTYLHAYFEYLGMAVEVEQSGDGWKPCEWDDFEAYDISGKIFADDGPLKCEPDTPQTKILGTWQLADNDTKLRRTGAVNWGGMTHDTVAADILVLNDSILRIHYSFKNDSIYVVATEEFKNIR